MRYTNQYHVKGWTNEQIQLVLRDQIPEGKSYHQCYYFSNKYLHRPFTPARKKQHARILEMGRQLITVFLPTITIFRHFLYKIFFKNSLFLYKNKCRLL